MLKKIAFFLITIILLLMGAVFLFAKDIEVSVSEKEAQSSIDEFLTSKEHTNRGVKVSPKYILLDFKANNSAEITSDLIINGFGYSGQFDGKFASGIKYRRPRLYLNKVSLIEGEFSTDDETQSELNDLKKVAIDIVRRQRTNHEPNDLNIPSDKSDLKNTEIVDEFILSTSKIFFENIPIYNITNSGKAGFAASLALKNVRFTDDAAVITLSPTTALLRILGILGVILLTLLWLLGPTIINLLVSSPKTESS